MYLEVCLTLISNDKYVDVYNITLAGNSKLNSANYLFPYKGIVTGDAV